MADIIRDFNADRTICDAASSGPWFVDENLANQVRQPNVSKRRRITTPPDFDGIADARFIAEARTGWPAALDEIERLREVALTSAYSAISRLQEERTRRCWNARSGTRSITSMLTMTAETLPVNASLKSEVFANARES